MSFQKYRLRDVATDFGTNAKEISEIVGKYFEKPKNNTQVLSDDELNVVFDRMTHAHQIDSLEQVFAARPKEQPKAAAPAGQNRQGDKPSGRDNAHNNNNNRNDRPGQNRNQPGGQNRSNNQPRPEAKPAQQQAAPAAKQPEPERKRERRVVDTSAVQVNSGRFADVDNLISERAQNFQGGKQRIGGGKGAKQQKQQQGNKKGNKSRNEQEEKMRRLQMEVARKAPTVVKIPDEITVGELASRMKKTAGQVITLLMKNGIMAGINQAIDYETAEFVATEMGCKVEKEVTVTIEERIIDDHVDTAEELQTRAPVVVVMGHVDHG